ncbi:MAG: hypothetical protein WC526_04080 [Patescibacteria group bacterium]
MRIKFFLAAVLLLVIGTAGVFFGYGWFINKQSKVATDTTGQQIINQDVLTAQTPEQTHAKFISALKDGNINAAVECCFREGDWESQKQFIQGVVSRGQLGLMVSDLDKITPDVVGDSKATYVYAGTSNGQKITNFITFIKNSQGVWLIESY